MTDTKPPLSNSDQPRWKMHEVTAELNARPFPEMSLPTNIFRLCVRGRDALTSMQELVKAFLPSIDWAESARGKVIRATYKNTDINIEQHTEFISLTLINPNGGDTSAAAILPSDWPERIIGDIVVAVDCQCRARNDIQAGWVCASEFDNGLAHAYFNFKVADDGHTKIFLDFEPDASLRAIGRVARQVIEIETYRSFAALGLPMAREVQSALAEISYRVPREPINESTERQGKATEERFYMLSEIANELESIWQRTSFRFNACQAYWSLVQSRLTSLNEKPLDRRLTIGAFLERRLEPAIATYQSTSRQRSDLANQVDNMATFLQTRIELALQTQNAELLASLNQSAQRQLRLQQTVEGISVVAISYYLVSLLKEPLPWLLDVLPALEAKEMRALLVVVIVPVVWFIMHKLLFKRDA
mgnify:CR=1 FL=1